VSLTIWPHTRNQLNLVKAQLSDARGKVVPLDEVLLTLIDHYKSTPPQPVRSKVKEYA
jgi:hypothetical protein